MLRFLKKHIGYFAAFLTVLSPFANAGVIVNDVAVSYGGTNYIDGGRCCFWFYTDVQDFSRDGSAVSAMISNTVQYSGLNASSENDTRSNIIETTVFTGVLLRTTH